MVGEEAVVGPWPLAWVAWAAAAAGEHPSHRAWEEGAAVGEEGHLWTVGSTQWLK